MRYEFMALCLVLVLATSGVVGCGGDGETEGEGEQTSVPIQTQTVVLTPPEIVTFAEVTLDEAIHKALNLISSSDINLPIPHIK